MSAPLDAAVPVVVALPPPRLCTYCGEWERRSEPYIGMRMAITAGSTNAVVTRSATVNPMDKNKAQLECQRSLWKPGDVLVTDLTVGKGTIVVRDWGLTGGVCRHQDAKASASFNFADDDNLVLSVTRGKAMVNQEWTRVR